MKNCGLVIFLSLTLLCGACKKDPQFIGLENVQVAGLKDSLLYFTLDYMVYNPNGVKSTLKTSNMEVFYKDELVGHGTLVNEMALASKDTIRIPVECSIGLEKLHRYYQEMLGSESTVFRLKGSNQVSFFMQQIAMDIDDEITLDTREIIKQEVKRNFSETNNFKVKSVALQRLPSLGESNFVLEIELFNRLPLDYTIEGMELNFYKSNKEDIIATWELELPIEQVKYEQSTMPVNAKVNNVALVRQGSLGWLLTQKARFNLFGEAQVRIGEYQFKVPIEDEIEIGL